VSRALNFATSDTSTRTTRYTHARPSSRMTHLCNYLSCRFSLARTRARARVRATYFALQLRNTDAMRTRARARAGARASRFTRERQWPFLVLGTRLRSPSRPQHARTHARTYARAQAPRGCAPTPQSDRRATCLCIAGNINIAIYARFNCSTTLPAPPSRPSAPPRLTGSRLTRPRIYQRGSMYKFGHRGTERSLPSVSFRLAELFIFRGAEHARA